MLFQLSPRSPPPRLKSSPQIKNSVYLAKSRLDEARHRAGPKVNVERAKCVDYEVRLISAPATKTPTLAHGPRDEEQPRKTVGKVKRPRHRTMTLPRCELPT